MNAVLTAFQEAIQDVATRVGPAVVGLGRGWARGSGVVVAPGRVLTAAHVLRSDEVAVTFADGRTIPGRVLGTDTDLDIAVIDVDTSEITPVEWAATGRESGAADGDESGAAAGRESGGPTAAALEGGVTEVGIG